MHRIWLTAAICISAFGVPLAAFQQRQQRQLQSPSSSVITRRSSYRLYYSQEDVINTQENSPRDIQSLQEWAQACEVQRAEGFQLTVPSSDDDDAYIIQQELGLENVDVFATTTMDIPANSPVLWVPAQMILSSHRAMEELRSQDMEAAEQRIEKSNANTELRQYYLMLKILVEYEKGQASPWFLWLNALPRYFSNAVSMTPFCYRCLPSLMASLAMKERANLNHLRVRQVPFLADDTKSNEDLWTWAYQIVYTRSFEGNNGDLCLAPIADMFNHGAEANIELSYDGDGNCFVQTTRDVPNGSPLHMSYGDPTNPSFLFARYGFLDKSSPATFCKIIIATPTKELVDMGYDPSRMLFYTETGEASEEVWDVLLYTILGENPDYRQEQHAFYQAHMTGEYNTKQQLHEQYYPRTSAKLLEHIDTFLHQLEELSGKTQWRDVREHPRLPLIQRHNDFVRNTFLAVRARYFQ